jgi:hypothetical protein
MSFSQPALSVDQQTEIAAYINVLRAKHQAPPIVWDKSIFSFSQQWSYYLSTNNLFQHSNNTSYGENLAYFQGYGTDAMALLKLSIDSWYNEVSKYDFNNPGFNSATGHFTCLVWKSTTNFAMGITINNSNTAAVITMNTLPPGNVDGAFPQNVLPVLSAVPPSPLPVPNPVPVPLPTPEPTPVPVPLPTPPNSINLTVISALYNIIYMMNARQNKYSIIYALNNMLTAYSQYLNQYVIDGINNVIYLFKVNSSRMTIVHAINSIIINLQSS